MDTDTPQLTLLEIKNHLYVHFLGKTTFSLNEDLRFVKLGVAFDDPKGKMHAYKAPLIVTALDDMVKVGLLLVLDTAQGVYMLTQPIGTFTQKVDISPYTAHLVAEAFNFFARQNQQAAYMANKLCISDVDINSVAQMCFALRDQIDDLHEQMEAMMDGDDGWR